MGLFDEIKCKYPLPVEGFNDHVFQTKDTPSQYMEMYEIREDGTLWHEEYDVEDRSDPTAEGFMALKGMATRINKRWEPCDMTGEINFYSLLRDSQKNGWIEFSAYFLKGKIQQLNLIEYNK